MAGEARVEPVLFITCSGVRVGGHGLVEALRAIEETGSIRSAAERLGINYRRLWARIRRAETILGRRLVEGDRRGSRLTEDARRLLSAYEEAARRLRAAGLLGGVATGVACRE